jgi:hypothetical protein
VNPEPRRKRLHPAIKVLAAIVVIAVVGVLFVRSATNTRAEPYAVDPAHLSGWTLASDTAQAAEDAAVALRPPAELPMNLFRQLFSRQMESLSTPLAPGIVLARKSELTPAATSDQLLALAREVGLDRARLTPRCVGYRRESAKGVTRQLYFLWFSSPEYDAFRQRLTSLGNAAYRPAGLSAVMLAAAEPGFEGWQPVVVDEARDCVAPIAVEDP